MRKRRSNPLDMSSLLDIIFILLIFSMLSMSFQKDFESIELNLPQEEGNTKESFTTPIRIFLKENGELYFENKKITWTELESSIKGLQERQFQLGIEKKVYYEDFIKLTSLLKKFGIEKIELLVESN